MNAMEGLDYVFAVLDNILSTKRKRHIAGGLLLSMSLLFGGVAVTIVTIKDEETKGE